MLDTIQELVIITPQTVIVQTDEGCYTESRDTFESDFGLIPSDIIEIDYNKTLGNLRVNSEVKDSKEFPLGDAILDRLPDLMSKFNARRESEIAVEVARARAEETEQSTQVAETVDYYRNKVITHITGKLNSKTDLVETQSSLGFKVLCSRDNLNLCSLYSEFDDAKFVDADYNVHSLKKSDFIIIISEIKRARFKRLQQFTNALTEIQKQSTREGIESILTSLGLHVG